METRREEKAKQHDEKVVEEQCHHFKPHLNSKSLKIAQEIKNKHIKSQPARELSAEENRKLVDALMAPEREKTKLGDKSLYTSLRSLSTNKSRPYIE